MIFLILLLLFSSLQHVQSQLNMTMLSLCGQCVDLSPKCFGALCSSASNNDDAKSSCFSYPPICGGSNSVWATCKFLDATTIEVIDWTDSDCSAPGPSEIDVFELFPVISQAPEDFVAAQKWFPRFTFHPLVMSYSSLQPFADAINNSSDAVTVNCPFLEPCFQGQFSGMFSQPAHFRATVLLGPHDMQLAVTVTTGGNRGIQAVASPLTPLQDGDEGPSATRHNFAFPDPCAVADPSTKDPFNPVSWYMRLDRGSTTRTISYTVRAFLVDMPECKTAAATAPAAVTTVATAKTGVVAETKPQPSYVWITATSETGLPPSSSSSMSDSASIGQSAPSPSIILTSSPVGDNNLNLNSNLGENGNNELTIPIVIAVSVVSTATVLLIVFCFVLRVRGRQRPQQQKQQQQQHQRQLSEPTRTATGSRSRSQSRSLRASYSPAPSNKSRRHSHRSSRVLRQQQQQQQQQQYNSFPNAFQYQPGPIVHSNQYDHPTSSFDNATTSAGTRTTTTTTTTTTTNNYDRPESLLNAQAIAHYDQLGLKPNSNYQQTSDPFN